MGSQSPPEGRALRYGFLQCLRGCSRTLCFYSDQIIYCGELHHLDDVFGRSDSLGRKALPKGVLCATDFLRMLARRKIGLRLIRLRRTAKDSSRTWYSSDRNIYATAKSITWTMYLIAQIAYGVAEPSRREGQHHGSQNAYVLGDWLCISFGWPMLYEV